MLTFGFFEPFPLNLQLHSPSILPTFFDGKWREQDDSPLHVFKCVGFTKCTKWVVHQSTKLMREEGSAEYRLMRIYEEAVRQRKDRSVHNLLWLSTSLVEQILPQSLKVRRALHRTASVGRF